MNPKYIYHRLPNAVIKLANIFLDYSYKLYLVGGSVRDILLEKQPSDFDFTTKATPDTICEILKGYKLITIGKKYGTIGVFIDGIHCEITTFRSDKDYHDNRHPKCVRFKDNINDDLKRRDFTINAIAYDILDKQIIDNHNGIYDLNNKIICAIGNPSERFGEDGLRILRAFSLHSTLGFTLDSATMEAIVEQKRLLNNIKTERIQNEIKKIINGKNVYQTFILIKKYDILPIQPIPKQFSKIPQKYRIYALFYIFDNMDFLNPTLKKQIITIKHISAMLDSAPFRAKDKKILLNILANKFGINNLKIAINITSALRKKANLKRYFRQNRIKKLLKLHINGNDLLNEGIAPRYIQHIKDYIHSKILRYETKNDRFTLLREIHANKANLVNNHKKSTNDI